MSDPHPDSSTPKTDLSTCSDEQARVLVVGLGFAGLNVVRNLTTLASSNFKLHITAVDAKEYFEFTPGAIRAMCEAADNNFSDDNMISSASTPSKTTSRAHQVLGFAVEKVRSLLPQWCQRRWCNMGYGTTTTSGHLIPGTATLLSRNYTHFRYEEYFAELQGSVVSSSFSRKKTAMKPPACEIVFKQGLVRNLNPGAALVEVVRKTEKSSSAPPLQLTNAPAAKNTTLQTVPFDFAVIATGSAYQVWKADCYGAVGINENDVVEPATGDKHESNTSTAATNDFSTADLDLAGRLKFLQTEKRVLHSTSTVMNPGSSRVKVIGAGVVGVELCADLLHYFPQLHIDLQLASRGRSQVLKDYPKSARQYVLKYFERTKRVRIVYGDDEVERKNDGTNGEDTRSSYLRVYRCYPQSSTGTDSISTKNHLRANRQLQVHGFLEKNVFVVGDAAELGGPEIQDEGLLGGDKSAAVVPEHDEDDLISQQPHEQVDVEVKSSGSSTESLVGKMEKVKCTSPSRSCKNKTSMTRNSTWRCPSVCSSLWSIPLTVLDVGLALVSPTSYFCAKRKKHGPRAGERNSAGRQKKYTQKTVQSQRNRNGYVAETTARLVVRQIRERVLLEQRKKIVEVAAARNVTTSTTSSKDGLTRAANRSTPPGTADDQNDDHSHKKNSSHFITSSASAIVTSLFSALQTIPLVENLLVRVASSTLCFSYRTTCGEDKNNSRTTSFDRSRYQLSSTENLFSDLEVVSLGPNDGIVVSGRFFLLSGGVAVVLKNFVHFTKMRELRGGFVENTIWGLVPHF
ncbi:unnamed protein product [Amoebophrya sp. A120]|nr:unnamed protein product [Amoebophrya sp. A120]|eukprot:GSA120T00024239001.1